MTGMGEDEVWDAMEELYRDGDVEPVPGLGEDVEPRFTLTDSGVDRATEVLRENDAAVMHLVAMRLSDMERSGDPEAVAAALTDLGEWLRDDAGVNLFRAMRRYDGETPVDVESLPEDFVERFDQDND